MVCSGVVDEVFKQKRCTRMVLSLTSHILTLFVFRNEYNVITPNGCNLAVLLLVCAWVVDEVKKQKGCTRMILSHTSKSLTWFVSE
jgi:hypothetical protein